MPILSHYVIFFKPTKTVTIDKTIERMIFSNDVKLLNHTIFTFSRMKNVREKHSPANVFWKINCHE